MFIRPLNDNVIVRLDEDRWHDIQKPELVHIPDAVIGRYKKRATSGTVISWGSLCRYPYKPGERIYFRWIDNRPGFKQKEGDFRFVKEHEVLAKDEDA